MILFELTNEDRARLQKFSGDKNTIFALKKLFLNECVKTPTTNETSVLAAQRVAIDIITDVFLTLSTIQSQETDKLQNENPAI